VQKFAYNMMRKNGVDRDVAEFISGRKPEGIGAKHYAELIMLAEEQYPKYAEYLKNLRGKV
jgi:intergrase/recombinase